MLNEAFINDVAQNEPDLARTIRDWINEIVEKVKEALGIAEPSLERAQKLWENAIRSASKEANKTQKNTTDEGSVSKKYAIITLPDGKKYVQADRQVLKGNDPEVWGTQIENYINENIRNGKDVIFPTSDGHLLVITEDSAHKLSDRHKSQIEKEARELLSDEDYALKGRMATHIDELIRVGKYVKFSEDFTGHTTVGKDGWEYYKAYFRDGGENGGYYELGFSAGINDDNVITYNINTKSIRKRNFPSVTGSSAKSGAQNSAKKVSNYSIPNPSGNVNTNEKFSIKETTTDEKRENANKALDYFGRTFSWNETGYLTTDGKKIDFSGKKFGSRGGQRTIDHREISDAMDEDYGDGSYSGALIQFMSEGNVRIMPESNGRNLSVMPTKAQEEALDDFISRARGEVIVDIDDLNGNTVVSQEYPKGTRAEKVLSDIREYFKNGTVPYVSELSKYRYSIKTPSKKSTEENLRDIIKMLKEEHKADLKRSKGVTVDKAKVNRVAKNFIKDYSSEADLEVVSDKINKLYEFIGNKVDEKGNELNYETLSEKANEIAKEIIEESVTKSNELAEEYPGLVAHLKDTNIIVSNKTRHDIRNFDDMKKRNKGRLKITMGKSNVDQVYQELSMDYSEFFSDDIINTSDMFERIVEVSDMLRPVEVNPYEGQMGDAVSFLAEDLIERYYEIPQHYTFADKQAMKL